MTRDELVELCGQVNAWTARHAEPIHHILLSIMVHDAEQRARLAEKDTEIASLKHCYNLLEERRAQLQADLDTMIGEAEWAHDRLQMAAWRYDERIRCGEFLCSNSFVQQWRERHKEDTNG